MKKAAAGLGDDFLDDVQVAIDLVRDHPELGVKCRPMGSDACPTAAFSVQHHLCGRRVTDHSGCCSPSTTSSRILEKPHMTANCSSSGRESA